MKSPKKQAPEGAFVYIIACGDRVKIGVSKDPAARLSDLRTGMPDRAYLVRQREFASRPEAFAAELALHRQLARHRSAGEWFNVPAAHAAKLLINYTARTPIEAGRFIADAFDKQFTEPTLL